MAALCTQTQDPTTGAGKRDTHWIGRIDLCHHDGRACFVRCHMGSPDRVSARGCAHDATRFRESGSRCVGRFADRPTRATDWSTCCKGDRRRNNATEDGTGLRRCVRPLDGGAGGTDDVGNCPGIRFRIVAGTSCELADDLGSVSVLLCGLLATSRRSVCSLWSAPGCLSSCQRRRFPHSPD